MSTKDTLDIVVIPVSVVLLAFLLPVVSSSIRNWQFRGLLLREIEEAGPNQVSVAENEPVVGRFELLKPTTKRFLHREFLAQPTENRDFLLSLPADLLYAGMQLWEARTPDEWMYQLRSIERAIPFWRRRGGVRKLREEWSKSLHEHGLPHSANLCLVCRSTDS